MLNKMVKLKNKKAFTLIEMMAVVAIVAILVAILVPVIGNSTVKSRAATNAANLRAVEAELATLKVSNPECFVAATKTSGADLWSMFKNGYIWFYDLVNGENSSSLNFDTVTASAGVLTFHTDNFTHSGESIDLAGVPTSVAVKADTGMDVPEGGEMVILLIDNEIRALYKGENNKYFDKDDFAEVAETGKFTGEGTSSGSDIWDEIGEIVDDATEWNQKTACNLNTSHTDDGTWHCKYCGKPMCELSRLILVVREDYGHQYNENNVCKGCGASYCSRNGHSYTHTDDTHSCTNAGCSIQNEAHSYVDGKCNACGAIEPVHICSSWDENHKCPTCEVQHVTSTWVWENDATYHYCSVSGCEAKAKHSGEVTGKTGSFTETCSCGATRTAKTRLGLELATWSK